MGKFVDTVLHTLNDGAGASVRLTALASNLGLVVCKQGTSDSVYTAEVG